jgi:hypothetical protein
MDDEPPDPTVSRRGVLIGGGIAVLAAAGGGIALGVATTSSADEHPSTAARIPAELAAAVVAETALIADVDQALVSARPHARRALREIRADHVAHLGALRASIADDVYPLATPTASGSASSSASSAGSASTPPPGPAPDVRAGELRASRAAAARAARMSGRDAALLASIAASEASHAELLS